MNRHRLFHIATSEVVGNKHRFLIRSASSELSHPIQRSFLTLAAFFSYLSIATLRLWT